MNFESCVEIILKHEGGYVNHPADPGGETNFGISKRTYPNLDIENLTKEQAKEIYRKDFWDRLGIESLSEEMRLPYFDCAVNQGPKRAQAFLDHAKNNYPDGILEGFITLRLNHYIALPTWPKFGAGWVRRLFDITMKAMGSR